MVSLDYNELHKIQSNTEKEHAQSPCYTLDCAFVSMITTYMSCGINGRFYITSASSIDIPGPKLFIAKIDTLRKLDGLCYQRNQCLLQNFTYLLNDAIQN